MITYINEKNALAYKDLFDKAAKFLKDRRPASLGISDWDSFSINSLNEYFAYLETLKNLAASENNESKLSFFIRLPLDEETFDINADTRTITVPQSFSRYGVGVQGDEAAEIIYFTVDRFFDHQDLANLNIAVQWESKNPDFPVGFTPNFGKEVINVQDAKTGEWKSKIIFGWPITGELTKVNGTIKFAVRFYRLNVDHSFSYSFATLPAEITINNTLNYTMVASETLPEVNHGQELLNRIRSFGVYDYDAEIPGDPTITVRLYALPVAGNTDVGNVIDLPANSDAGRELIIAAQPTTSGALSYEWYKYVYSNGEYSRDYQLLSESGDTAAEEFREITDDIAIDDPSYFYDEDGEFISDLSLLLEEDNGEYVYVESLGFKRLNTEDSYVKIYKEFSVATVHSTGKYFVDIIAQAGANQGKTTSEIITIPGPEKPVISYDSQANITTNDNTVHIILDQNDTATLAVTAQAGEFGKDPEEVGDYHVSLAYSWYKSGESESVDDDANHTYTQTDAALGSTLSIEYSSTENLDETFYAKVTASRNGEQASKDSFVYRITPAPEKPVLKYRELRDNSFVYVEKDYTTQTTPITISLKTRADEFNKITFAAEPPAQCDELSYIWMKANIQATNNADYYPNSNIPIMQVDIDNALPDLFNDIDGSPDVPADGSQAINLSVIDHYHMGTVVDAGENGNMPSLQFNEDTRVGDYYYCIVVNKLNNHRIANVTPFFQVT